MSDFLKGAATSAVQAFVQSLLDGKSRTDAQAAAEDALNGAIVAVDSRWAKLAEPLSQIARAEIQDAESSKVDLFDAETMHKSDALGLAWELQANANVGVEIDVLDPKLDSDRRKEIGIKDEDEARTVVAYAISGALGASVGGTSAAPVWQLGATATASVSGRMEWYVAATSDPRLGEAFIAALPLMPPPMDLRAMVEAARHPDFWGCSTRIEGAVQAGFSANATWSGVGGSLSIEGKNAAMGLSLGVSGQASFALGGMFKLHCIPVRRPEGFRLRVQLEQLSSREKSFGLELAIGADFSALTKAAETYLRARTPKPNEHLLQLLTEPASQITEKLEAALRKLLGNTALKDLVPLLASTGGGEEKKKAVAALAKELVGPLADKLNLLSGEIEGSETALDAFAKQLASRLFGGASVPDEATKKVEAFVVAAGTDVLAKLTEGINELAAALDGKAGSAAEEIIKPLAALGEQIAEAIGDLSVTITNDKIVEDVKTGLNRYAKLRNQVLSVLGDAQRAKVTLALGIAVQENRSQQLVFEGDFALAADMAPAERLFSALWRGDLREFSLLKTAAEDSGSLSNVSGWLERTAKRSATESVTLNVFGFEFSNTLVRTTDIVLRSDLSGNLIAANGAAQAVAITSNRWVQRKARLGVSVRLAAAQTPEARGEIEFAGAFSAGGKDLDERLFNDLQRSVALLTGQSAPVDLARLLGSSTKFDSTFWRHATFVLPMSLTVAEFSRLVNTDSAAARLKLLHRALDAMDRSLTNTNIFPFDPRPTIRFAGCVQEVLGAARDADKLEYIDRFPLSLRWTDLAAASGTLGFGTVPSSSLRPTTIDGLQLVAFQRLAKAVRAFDDLLVACRGIKSELATATTSSSEAVFDRCVEHLKSASEALAVFAIASETSIGNNEAVSWPLVAFAAAVSEIARGDEGPRFMPLITLADRPDRPIPLIA